MRFLKQIACILFPLVASACQADPPPGKSPQAKDTPKAACETLLPDPDVLPSLVIAGTDAVEMASFKPAQVITGAFSSEAGGAKQKVTINKAEFYSITRTYSEPGLPDNKKSYSGLCVHENKLIGEGIVVSFVENGLLLWEADSGLEFISNELWTLFNRSK
ncbi:hypothetical protein WKI13_10470 [Teredinibacter turnerae]|uniref:hypothetical protein n=1 Tax=Teredinibacter turnerae TaxID=2426 RepID=UPI00037C7DCD|nr:hypothetical protein [Teredinibacter turnerae]